MNRTTTFETLIDHELPMLRQVVWRIMRNVADTDEVIQNVLLKAWQKFGTFRNESKLSSWVCRIAVNEAYDQKRKNRKEREVCAQIGDNPSADGVNETLLCALDHAVEALPANFRQALLLTVVEGLSAERAAALSECNLNTFYWRVSKAKTLLRNALKEVTYE